MKKVLKWERKFTLGSRSFYYNRIPFNNRAERAVEVPIAFDFLATRQHLGTILEIGNVLQYYENALSDHLQIRERRIIDKFEVADGVENKDLMELSSDEKYQTILCISTVEHVGQTSDPAGTFGERHSSVDLEAPLKAIAKIYDLLAIGGKALITVPFGKLIDGGWYVQFSKGYLDLLSSKYNIPSNAINAKFLKAVAIEPKASNPHQLWIEVEAEALSRTRYNDLWSGARGIAVLELEKQEDPFTLLLQTTPTNLSYDRSVIARTFFLTMGLVRSGFNAFMRLF